MLAAIPAFGFTAAPLRRSSNKIFAGLLTGLVVGTINVFLELFGARHGIYFVNGLVMFAHSSLALTIAWILFTSAFALGTELIKNLPDPRAAIALYISAGTIIGIFSDYSGQRWLGQFQMGPNGNWLFIIAIWIVMVPATIAIYKTVDKIFARRSRATQ